MARIFELMLLASAILLSADDAAFAYIDPGSGSVLTTAIIGFFAAIGYTVRKYYYRLTDAVLGRKPQAAPRDAGDQS